MWHAEQTGDQVIDILLNLATIYRNEKDLPAARRAMARCVDVLKLENAWPGIDGDISSLVIPQKWELVVVALNNMGELLHNTLGIIAIY